MGFAYQNLRQYDSALTYHSRALSLRQSQTDIDQKLVANNLFGIANAYWGQENLSEALVYAQQSLRIHESVKSRNESNIASNLAILANIYHHSGDDIRALELAKRALTIFEHCSSYNSVGLITVLNNIGTIQVSAGLLNDALLTFIRLLHICQNDVPKDHLRRTAIHNNIQQIIAMQQEQENPLNSFSHLWTLLAKLVLF